MKHFDVVAEAFTPVAPPADVVRRFKRKSSGKAANGSFVADAGFALLDANPDHIQLIDARGKVLWMNRAARSRQGLVTARMGRFFDAAQYWPGLAARQLASAIADAENGATPRFATSTHGVDGQHWWDVRIVSIADTGGGAGRFLLIAQDVTEQYLAARAAERAVGHDTLTGLADGDLFRRRVEALAEAGDHGFCVLMVGLVQGHEHYDMLGKDASEDVLRRVAEQLTRSIRKGETAARFGSDTFGILLRDRTGDSPGSAMLRAQAIVGRLTKPDTDKTRQSRVSVSIGVARCPDTRVAPGAVCSNAQFALEEARKIGRGQIVEFDASMQKSQAARNSMLALAECALANRNTLAYYQPKVDLKSGRIIGLEALLRWRSVSGTIEMPAAIWPAFADPTLSVWITETMLGRVIQDLKRWQRRGIAVPVSINITDNDLRRPDFAERLIARLAAAGLPPSCIELEITETVVLGRNCDHIGPMLHALRAAGIRIALDDFGTGYASLLHLKHLPVDVIKIDRSFVSNLGDSQGDCAIVEAMLVMAKRLGIEVVAEGVESAVHARFLHKRGCNIGQGYFFGKAMAAHEVPLLLAAKMPDFAAAPNVRCAGLNCARCPA